MKLVLVGNPNSVHVRRYVSDLAKRDHEIYLIGEHQLTKTKPDGCSFYDLTQSGNIKKLRYILWQNNIQQLLRLIQPEIIHAIGVASAGWLAASTDFHPFVVSATGSDLMLLEQRSLIHQLLSKWSIRRADRVICVSRPLFNRAIELGSTESKTFLVYIGIDTTTFKPGDKTAARKKLGLPDVPLVLSIRAMSQVYRPLDIAQAIPLILRELPETRFVVFTYNTDIETFRLFKQIIKNQGLDEAILYINELPNDQSIADYYQAADVAISIPESDGTPSSVIEALSCGLPVVATNLPSILEWVKPAENGFLVPIGDVEAIKNAIISILTNTETKGFISSNASYNIQTRADREKCLDKLEEVYRSLKMQ